MQLRMLEAFPRKNRKRRTLTLDTNFKATTIANLIKHLAGEDNNVWVRPALK